MITRIIGSKETFLNRFTKYGRMRNQIIQEMKDNGCKIIRERKENCNSRVLLGYKNEYVLANYAARVCRNGNIEKKTSTAQYSPIPSSLKSYFVQKQYLNKNGDCAVETRSLKIQDGNVLEKTEEYKSC